MEQAGAVETWELLGIAGRALVLQYLPWVENGSAAPKRYPPNAMIHTDVERMLCFADPIERYAGCPLGANGMWACCTRDTWPLRSKKTLQLTLCNGPHTARLVATFLKDPYLAYPADIPAFTRDVLRWAERHEEAVRQIADKRAHAALAEQTAILQRKADEAAKKAVAAAHAAYKKSRAFRIEKREKQIENEREKIADHEAAIKRARKRIAKHKRSITQMKKAEAKK